METKVTLDKDLEQRVRQLAEARNLSVFELLQLAINDFVEREELKQKGQSPDHQVSAEEVGDWLTNWGEGEGELPQD